MQQLLRQVLTLVNAEPSSSVDCNNGSWNATTGTCDCANGWTTDWTNQDILGGGIVYCSSRASTPAPGNTTAATNTTSASLISAVWIAVVVVVVVAVVLLGVVFFCCCRQHSNEAKRRRQRELEEAEAEAEEQQRHLAEMKRRQQEDEADWNRKALIRRELYDPELQWHLRSDATMGELWSGSLAAATTNSQLVSSDQAFLGSPAASQRSRSRNIREFSVTDPYAMAMQGASPSPRPDVAPSDVSSNLYDSSSSACTTASDECIYTQYSESPPPPLRAGAVMSGVSPFTTPRNVHRHDPNDPF